MQNIMTYIDNKYVLPQLTANLATCHDLATLINFTHTKISLKKHLKQNNNYKKPKSVTCTKHAYIKTRLKVRLKCFFAPKGVEYNRKQDGV